MARLEFQRAAVGGFGFAVPAHGFQQVAEIIVREGEVGPRGDGAPVGRFGVVHAADFGQQIAIVVVRIGQAGCQIKRAAVGGLGFGVAPQFVQQASQGEQEARVFTYAQRLAV